MKAPPVRKRRAPTKNASRTATAASKNATIDLVIAGVGRIQKRCAGVNANVIQGYRTMLRSLAKTGKTDLCRAVRDDEVSLADLYHSFQLGKLKNVVVAGSVIPAERALLDWLENKAVSDATRVSYRDHIRILVKYSPDAMLSELPQMVQTLRDHYEKADKGKDVFRIARAICLNFAKSQFGKSSAPWGSIADIPQLPRSGRPRKGMAREVVDVLATVKAMKAPYGDMFWTMCLTGMGRAEYFIHGFEVLSDRVHIKGKKDVRKEGNRDRVVPQMQANLHVPTPWTTKAGNLMVPTFQPLEDALKKVRPDWVLHDPRRTFAMWMEKAGIDESHRDSYMGHSTKRSMRKLYTQHEMERYLEADREKLESYIRAEIEASKKERPAPKPVTFDLRAA